MISVHLRNQRQGVRILICIDPTAKLDRLFWVLREGVRPLQATPNEQKAAGFWLLASSVVSNK